MGQMSNRVRNALERVAWKWAEEERTTTRRDCAPLVSAIMEREGFEATAEATERCIAEFCEMVLDRKRALIELERLESVRASAVPVRRARP